MKHSNRNEVNMVICPKCGKVYHWSKKKCPECGHPQYPIYKNPVLLLIASIIILITLIRFGIIKLPAELVQNVERLAEKAEKMVTQTPEAVPIENKTVLKQPDGELVCKLTVRTTYRIDGTDFYIYCKDLNGDNDCAFYLENGTTFDLMMPLGEYSVYYCTGRTWYGSEELFGVETICCKMDDTLNFTKETTDNTIHYMGWEITLQTVEGNQAPEYINKSDFPR